MTAITTATSEHRVILFGVEDIVMVVQTLGVPEILPRCFKIFRLNYNQVYPRKIVPHLIFG